MKVNADVRVIPGSWMFAINVAYALTQIYNRCNCFLNHINKHYVYRTINDYSKIQPNNK